MSSTSATENSTFFIDKNTGYAYKHVLLSSSQAATFHTMMLDTKAIVAEADSIIQETHRKYLSSIVLPSIVTDWTDEEEQEWDVLFAKPHVQAGLNRLAEEAERQIALGDFEEGGFAFE